MEGDDDLVGRAVAAGSPAVDDIAAKLVRARVAAALFGAVTPLRVGRYELERQLGAGGGGTVFAATDPELSRRVALKLLFTRGRRDQMLAEAHALARLAHPNVTPIFDVGTHDDQIFLVMELVEGGTLRTWLEASPRTVRDVVRTYRDAGAGLAAAHRAGFIHRDFKPDNALIGVDDQRVRVVDFGLVHEGGEARAGLGTPRYMPPEQAAGGAVTPAADQYSFCASLREALHARKIDDAGTRADAIPRWLDDILARGLARDPAARYPSMDTLLDALALDPAARWRRRGLVAGVLALGTTAFVVGRAQSESLPDCDGGQTELAAVWSPSVRDAIAAKLDALGTPYAKQVKPQLVAALDGYAKTWTAGHLDACKAHRRGAQSAVLFDRRMRCLDAAHAALGSVNAVVRAVKAPDLPKTIVAIGELPALARCADVESLSTNIAPPPPAKAAAVAALERELAAREVEVRAGRTNLVVEVEALVGRARAVGYSHLTAKALRLRALCAILSEKALDAIAPLVDATQFAFLSGDDELGVEVVARRMWAEVKKDGAEPLAGIDPVEAIARRLPSTSRGTRALFMSAIGSVHLARGERAAARIAFGRAHAEQSDVTGPMATELANIGYNYAITLDDPVERDAMFIHTIEKLTALVGRGHPTTLKARCLAGARLEDAGVAEQTLADAAGELRDLHPNQGALLGQCASDAAWHALMRGDDGVARRWFDVVVVADASGATKDAVALARAHLLRLEDRPADAVRAFEAHRTLLPDTEEPWWRQLAIIDVELGLALAHRDLNVTAAKDKFERVRQRILFVQRTNPNAMRRRLLDFIDRMATGSP